MTKTFLGVKIQILTCTDCHLSSQCRTPVPMEVGSSETNRFVVVGEAPGRVEDYKGRPFMGPAGSLLKRELRIAGLNPDAGTYINTVSCWPKRVPPTPTRDEVEACKGNLIDQLDLTGDQLVLLTGAVALNVVLPRAQLTYTLGRWFAAHGRMFCVAYHPAYVARNGSALQVFRQQLVNFGHMVRMNSWVDMDTRCLYCNARQDEGEQVCRKHKTTWVGDLAKWKRRPGIQGSMF